ncbi:hypothetical protein [Acinetobacter brisouii]|uniref:hypothetical protein n=1 Tax=Acinetobacter brisouii TaxID=396323 RepID=UPI00124F3C18|nr:hypothetical protein [Acinetobacter brisouii]
MILTKQATTVYLALSRLPDLYHAGDIVPALKLNFDYFKKILDNAPPNATAYFSERWTYKEDALGYSDDFRAYTDKDNNILNKRGYKKCHFNEKFIQAQPYREIWIDLIAAKHLIDAKDGLKGETTVERWERVIAELLRQNKDEQLPILTLAIMKWHYANIYLETYSESDGAWGHFERFTTTFKDWSDRYFGKSILFLNLSNLHNDDKCFGWEL